MEVGVFVNNAIIKIIFGRFFFPSIFDGIEQLFFLASMARWSQYIALTTFLRWLVESRELLLCCCAQHPKRTTQHNVWDEGRELDAVEGEVKNIWNFIESQIHSDRCSDGGLISTSATLGLALCSIDVASPSKDFKFTFRLSFKCLMRVCAVFSFRASLCLTSHFIENTSNVPRC